MLTIFFAPNAFSQCQPNEIALVKSGNRDWTNDFNNLEKKFGTGKTSKLRSFFYENNQLKTCISFTDLQRLKAELEATFPIAQNQNDPLVQKFTATIKGVAVSNPPLVETAPVAVETGIASADSAIDAQTTEQPLDPRTEIEQLKSSKTTWMIAALLAGITAVGLGFFYFLQTKKLQETIERQTQQIQTIGNRNFAAEKSDSSREIGFKNDAKQWKDKYLASDRQLRQLSDEFASYKNKQQNSPAKSMAGGKPIGNQIPAKVVEANIEPAFYLSNPTANEAGFGFFKDIRHVQINPVSSFYKFVPDGTGKTAKFWFLNSASTVQSALIYPETYIDPVCEYDNYHSTAKKIDTSEPGMAEKQGENWQVIRKAKIKFV